MRRAYLILPVLSLFVAGATAVPAAAAPADLDTTFDGDGLVTTDFGADTEQVTATAIEPDGQIVAAGVTFNGVDDDFALARHNLDGSLDTTFGAGGKVTTNFAGGPDVATGVAVLSDGRIVAAGTTGSGTAADFAIAMYNTDGSLDTNFGSGGKTTVDFVAGSDQGTGVAVQSDDKIVVVGFGSGDFLLARLDAAGLLDSNFDGDGKVTTNFGSSDQGLAVTIQTDGRIVVAGMAIAGTSIDFALARYNIDGSLDPNFDTDGKVTTDIAGGQPGDSDEAHAVALQADGRIVAAGLSYNGTDNDFALIRYNSTGSLDGTFDTDGKVTTDFGSTSDRVAGVALQQNGRIVAVGSRNNFDFALARYTASGALDATFDGDGMLITDFPGGANTDAARTVAIQTDGKIVASGLGDENDADLDFALARYEGDSPGPACTITGTAGNDRIGGSPGDDVICGLGGNDRIDGMGGNDTIFGGEGADSIKGGSGNDALFGEAGADKLDARDRVAGNDTGDGGADGDACAGDPGDTFTNCP